jgi:hypothetical protein
MLERITRHILALGTNVSNDNARIGDWHGGHVNHLDSGEHWINKVSSSKDHLFLQSF